MLDCLELLRGWGSPLADLGRVSILQDCSASVLGQRGVSDSLDSLLDSGRRFRGSEFLRTVEASLV